MAALLVASSGLEIDFVRRNPRLAPENLRIRCVGDFGRRGANLGRQPFVTVTFQNILSD